MYYDNFSVRIILIFNRLQLFYLKLNTEIVVYMTTLTLWKNFEKL